MVDFKKDKFQNIHETFEFWIGKSLVERYDLLLLVPPYNVRSQQNSQKSDHKLYDAKAMEAFCQLAELLLKCKEREHIFRSDVQSAI